MTDNQLKEAANNKFFDLYLQSYDLEVWYCNT